VRGFAKQLRKKRGRCDAEKKGGEGGSSKKHLRLCRKKSKRGKNERPGNDRRWLSGNRKRGVGGPLDLECDQAERDRRKALKRKRGKKREEIVTRTSGVFGGGAQRKDFNKGK